MLIKAYRRHQARRAVMQAAAGVAASYEPSLKLQFDPDDLAHLRKSVEAFERLELFPYRVRWQRHQGSRTFGVRSSNTAWPWWELVLPRWGSLIVGRKLPRS